jgi:hypothetical protein
VRLFTRNSHDFGKRFHLVVAAIAALPARSCLIDGEAIVSDEAGLAVFELLRSRSHDHAAVLCAFDLLELDGEDLRRRPIEQRKRALAKLLHGPRPGMVLNEHYVGDGDIVYRQACKLGCEGIVSKRLGSSYRSGRSRQWLKLKNPTAPAARREAEEHWSRRRRAASLNARQNDRITDSENPSLQVHWSYPGAHNRSCCSYRSRRLACDAMVSGAAHEVWPAVPAAHHSENMD